jgi:hypothetical protein
MYLESQLTFAVVGNEKLAIAAGENLGNQEKRHVSFWKPLPGNG